MNLWIGIIPLLLGVLPYSQGKILTSYKPSSFSCLNLYWYCKILKSKTFHKLWFNILSRVLRTLSIFLHFRLLVYRGYTMFNSVGKHISEVLKICVQSLCNVVGVRSSILALATMKWYKLVTFNEMVHFSMRCRLGFWRKKITEVRLFLQVADNGHLQAGSWMGKMPRPIPGLGKFLSSGEDHLLTVTGLSLRLIALKITPIQVAIALLWVSFTSKLVSC